MTIVLARSRPFFGAQITCIPAIYAASLLDGSCSVFCKYRVGYIFKQLPWVNDITEETRFSKEVFSARKHDFVFNLRPKKIAQAQLISLFGGGQLLSVPKQVDKNKYRALWHLEPVLKKLDVPASELLARPFIELANTSSLILPCDTLHIAIMPGAGAGAQKKWGTANYLECFQTLASAYPNKQAMLHVILGPDELDEKHAFEQYDPEHICIHNKLCLADLSSLLVQSDLVIANDCGPSHIAQCLQRPSVILYDKDKPEWFYPHAQAVALFPAQGQPISTLTVEQVSQAACALLEQP